MCRGCWERAGSPTAPGNTEVARLAAGVKAAGFLWEYGALHIAVSDWNLDDVCLRSCLREADLTPDETKWAEAMLALPEPDRFAVMGLAEGYWNG